MVAEISFLSSLKLETNRHHIVQGVTTVISLFFFLNALVNTFRVKFNA